MQRRGFLKAMLAAAAAPAIVRAESLMKIVVPEKKILTLDDFVSGSDVPSGDFTVEMWVKPTGELGAAWKHLSAQQVGTTLFTYENGVLVPPEKARRDWVRLKMNKGGAVLSRNDLTIDLNPFQYVDEVRVTKKPHSFFA